jgi:hypothetical protein
VSAQPDPHDETTCGAWWLNEDGDYWVCAVTFPDPERAASEIIDQTGDSGQVLVLDGRGVRDLIDCEFDGCAKHESDCPSFLRDVWSFTSYKAWGTSWADLEAAIARGARVFPGDELEVRDGQVHWKHDCECGRCDALPVCHDEAPSVPMFEEATQ